MNHALAVPAPSARSGRGALILMLGLFLLPVLVASGLYLFGWRPTSTGNHGELLLPPRPLPEAILTDAAGKTIKSADLKGRWLMVYVAGAACDLDCRGVIDQMRRVHVLLNKEMDRVGRIALVPGGSPDPALAAAVVAYPDMRLLAAGAGLRAAFPGSDAAAPGRVFLMDPAGNVMMRYAPDFKPGGMKQDLERLLKYSWIG